MITGITAFLYPNVGTTGSWLFGRRLLRVVGHRVLCIFWMGWIVCAGSVQAQENYQDLWARGAYREAIQTLEARFEQLSYRPRTMRADYAELLFTVGRVDDAIAELEQAATGYISPLTLVRLAEMYRYRGRVKNAEMMVAIADRQVNLIPLSRQDLEDRVAAGRVMALKGDDPRAVLRHYALLDDYVPALMAAGDLALQKRAFDVAAQKYGRVLSLNSDHQAALAGLSQCYLSSGDPRGNETLARLLALNPHHPDAHILQAENLLDLGKTDAALDTLDAVLAINPNHLNALALVAAGHFLQDDDSGLAVVQKRALAFNPFDSGIYRVPGRVASRHYRFEEGKAFQEQALTVNEKDDEARLLLAFDLLRLGQDAMARNALERVFAADPFSVRAYNLLEATDVIGKFVTLEGGIFKLQMPASEAEIMAPDMFALLDEAATRYQDAYQMTLESPVLVQVFDDHDVFMVRSVGLPGNAGHLGICFGRLVTMDSPRARPPNTVNWQQVLWHEFVHVITLQKTKNRMTRWLSEGISVYEETQRDSAWGQKLDANFKKVIDEGGYPGMTDLEVLFTTPQSPTHLMFGYFAAGEFVQWYIDTYGMPALVGALDAIGQGKKAEVALATASGETRTDLDARFQAQMTLRCAPLMQMRDGSAFHRALKTGKLAVAMGDTLKAVAAYREAFELYPDYAGEGAPLRELALLYAQGDTTAYCEVLQDLVMWDATAFDACVQLGTLQALQGNLMEAKNALDRAFAINPFQMGLLVKRVQVQIDLGDFDGAVKDLRRLLLLDDQAEYRLQLARVLLQKGRRDVAHGEVLALLEKWPHFWAAQELLLEMVERP